jgi:hypothetical protein
VESIDPNKYIVFKREDFFQMMGFLALPPWTDNDGNLIGSDIDCAPLAEQIQAKVLEFALADAVVIRRQDLFAGPALHSYASSISIASKLNSDPDLTKGLRNVADYFHDQAVLADEEGWKLPD